MNTSEWLRHILDAYSKQLPFACYMEPEAAVVVSYFQKDKHLHQTSHLTEEGFRIAPFQFNGKNYYIPRAASTVVETDALQVVALVERVDFRSTSEEQKQHESLVSRAISEITTGIPDKIVVSRKKKISLKTFSITELVKQLFGSYPTAFKYIWYHPETGLWCGATPEILIETDGVSFATMSLAGTRVYNENNAPLWNQKELDEQQIVTDSIRDTLQNLSSDVKISSTHNHRAGNLVHLRTHIKGLFIKGNETLSSVVSALHPTPAVCGRPKALSASFIKEYEGYDREFYTGFVGPTHGENIALYVNLRCMKIVGNQASLYVGGGITEASNASAEWQETENKLQTMLRVLHPML